jgi:hypothetical protein
LKEIKTKSLFILANYYYDYKQKSKSTRKETISKEFKFYYIYV